MPIQALVEGLHARGHEVAVWSHASNCAAFEQFGAGDLGGIPKVPSGSGNSREQKAAPCLESAY